MAGILSDMSQGILGVLRKNNPRLAGILGAATDPQFYKDTASNLAHVPVGMTAAAIGAPADIMSMGSNFKPGEMPLSTDWLLKRWYAGRNDGVPETARIASMLPNDASDVAPLMKAMTVFHGSPHKFDKFDASKIGTGEGAQAYGHGLYFAENPDVSKSYRENLTDRNGGSFHRTSTSFRSNGAEIFPQNFESWQAADIAHMMSEFGVNPRTADGRDWLGRELGARGLDQSHKKEVLRYLKQGVERDVSRGALYHVDLPDDQIAKMLDWDAPLSKQPPEVRQALKDAGVLKQYKENLSDFASPQSTRGGGRGHNLYAMLSHNLGGDQKASEYMRSLGIPGIKYFDGGSRTAGEGTRNFVVFPGNEGILKILKRE